MDLYPKRPVKRMASKIPTAVRFGPKPMDAKEEENIFN
jgi:hypothetical protein